MARITPKIALSLWEIVTLPEEDRAMATCNMNRKIGKDSACGSGDMLADRQTDRQTDTYTHRQIHNISPPLPRAK